MQIHHWIEQSRIKNTEKYPFLGCPPMKEDLLKSKSNLSLIVGHNGGHKKTYNDLLDEQLFDIIYKLEEKYGLDYMLKSNNSDFINYVNSEVEKLIMTLRGNVNLNNVIMNNNKLIILD